MPATTDPAPVNPARTTTGDRRMAAILAVSNGDVLLIGSSYYHVVTVREPTHPLAPGVVWEGHWWRASLGHWGDATVVHAHSGLPSTPQVLSAESRALCGWGDL